MTLRTAGEEGTDWAFIDEALRHDHGVCVENFSGRELHTHTKNKIRFLTRIDKEYIDIYKEVTGCSEDLGIKMKTIDHHQLRSVSRDYFVSQNSNSIYAVGSFENPATRIGIGIQGRSSWTCQYFVRRMSRHYEEGSIPLYFYDQTSNRWHQCRITKDKVVVWISIQKPPKPRDSYGCVGTREITERGIDAIRNLYL